MSRKAELYALTAELHGRGFTSTVLLGQILNLSHTYVRNVLIDLGIERRKAFTIDDVALRCPDELIARIDSFTSATRSSAKDEQAA